LGRLLAGVTTLVGISVVALPVGILASAFVEELRTKRDDDACPHCGGAIPHEEAT
jgi:voltage-gated potassium channel